jgi:NAD(P)-dependent dehydrogenase (short-subunit alcohol dehydrogenase family)
MTQQIIFFKPYKIILTVIERFFMSESLSGRVAVVTGGAKGFGYGAAKKLAEKGCRVWITGRDTAALEKAKKELGVNIFRADVTSPADWESLKDRLMSGGGRLDIMVNNAGEGGKIAEIELQSPGAIKSCIDINLTGAILGCRMAAGIMKKQKSGTIINISSVCAREAWPGWAVYSAAKAGLLQMTNCLYTETRPFGVRVTTVIPSWGATGFAERANLPSNEETARKSIQPDELGEQIVSICSLPAHLTVLDVTILPLVQEINPL